MCVNNVDENVKVSNDQEMKRKERNSHPRKVKVSNDQEMTLSERN